MDTDSDSDNITETNKLQEDAVTDVNIRNADNNDNTNNIVINQLHQEISRVNCACVKKVQL